MTRAGRALREVLETYNISQNRLAVVMDIGRSTVNHWVLEKRDPTAESLLGIIAALEKINPAAAEDFLWLYLGRRTNKADA